MPRQIVTKAAFETAYRRLMTSDRELVDAALTRFQHYLKTHEAQGGLGIKHLGGRTYEFRAGLALRVVYVVDGERVVLALLGTHDDVHRFLKRQ